MEENKACLISSRYTAVRFICSCIYTNDNEFTEEIDRLLVFKRKLKIFILSHSLEENK